MVGPRLLLFGEGQGQPVQQRRLAQTGRPSDDQAVMAAQCLGLSSKLISKHTYCARLAAIWQEHNRYMSIIHLVLIGLEAVLIRVLLLVALNQGGEAAQSATYVLSGPLSVAFWVGVLFSFQIAAPSLRTTIWAARALTFP